MKSAIYTGTIRHRRFEPVPHAFNYRLFMLYLDLNELDRVFEGSRLFSARRRTLAHFRRTDHFGDPRLPLDTAVRELVRQRTGAQPRGPIRLLTHLRYFGYVFNPVSFYYCFNQEDTRVDVIVAEVNNTPWGERHCYVLKIDSDDRGNDGILTFTPEKAMHVSPFMPMDVEYDWRFGSPEEQLNVHMINTLQGRRIFDATLRLRRRELTPASLRRALLSFPLMTLKVIAAIHWQAFKLWVRKCPVHDHPDKRRAAHRLGQERR